MSRRAEWEKIRERRVKVDGLVTGGLKAREIAVRLKVSENTVWSDLNALGIKLSERRAITPTERQEEAGILKHLGYNLREIGETMGISPENARQHLIAYRKKIENRST